MSTDATRGATEPDKTSEHAPAASPAGGPGTTPSNREILGLAIPALGSLAADPLLGLVDTAMVGRLGAVPLAALGAAVSLLGLLISTLIFLEYGTTARLSRRYGSGETALLAREAVQMAWLATVLGAVVALCLYSVPRLLMRLVQVPPEVSPPGAAYLRIRAFGAVPALWILAGHGVFRGLQNTRTPLYIVLAMNVANALLDLLLIFGWRAAGIPPFGILGAAWASVAASWAGGLSFLLILRGRLRAGSPRPSGVPEGLAGGNIDPSRAEAVTLRPHWATLRDMLALCRDLLLRTVALRAALFSGTRAAAALGVAVLAAHQVGWQLWSFLALALDSLAIAGQALVGRALGAGRPREARAVGHRLNRWGLGLGAILAATFLLLHEVLPRIFTSDPAVLAAVASIFPLLALMQIPNALLFVLDGLLIGASDMAFIRDSMVALGLFGVVAAWLGGRIGGSLLGVWIGISIFMIARLALMAWRWRGGRWAA
jgi:putative MATE family efflux protein